MALGVWRLSETPSSYGLTLSYKSRFYLFYFVFVCRDALFSAKSMVPQPTILRRLRHLIVILGPLAILLFPPAIFSPPPWSVCVCPLGVGWVVLYPPIGHKTARDCLLLALCLYPLLVFFTSIRCSCDVHMLVHQLDISQD